ncbi:MAG: RluA family pseudouridine synthase [Oscillospiraceae bacterium]
MEKIKLTASSNEEGMRLDAYIAVCVDGCTRSAAQILIDKGLVTVNDVIVPKSYKLRVNDIVVASTLPLQETTLLPECIPLEIVYEDASLLVVNKPKGMVVHPAVGNWNGTLVNALLYHCKGQLSGINGEIRPGIVHRIDKDTSGLLVVAKNNDAHLALSEQMSVHSITRVYNAVVYGGFKENSGFVDKPIGRSSKDRKKMSITDIHSRNAFTEYEVMYRFNGFTQLALKLKKGRTHQIRVHMASIGHPVAGDAVYGPKKVIASLNGQCLHARTLGFVHPETGKYMEFTSELPQYFVDFLNTLQREML